MHLQHGPLHEQQRPFSFCLTATTAPACEFNAPSELLFCLLKSALLAASFYYSASFKSLA
jgi:hypothetical protein